MTDFSEGPKDSAGRLIGIGSCVCFRGEEYTIKEFKPGEGRFGTCAIVFDREPHIAEVPDEINVDLIS